MSLQTLQEKLPAPPRLLKSLVSGFDSVASHVAVILPPILLDLFFWLGPRLHLKSFLQPFINSFPSIASSLPSGITDLATIQLVWQDFADQFNLFSLLRTFPVGVSSLLSLSPLERNPLWQAPGMDAGSFAAILGWGLLLVLLGWVLGGLYFFWVSGVALKMESRAAWKPLKEAVLVSLIWVVLLIFISLPALLLLSVLAVLSPVLAQVGSIAVVILAVWLLMPIFFSAHGIYSMQLDAFRSIMASLRMVRFTLPNTGLFLLAYLLVNQGLNFLWTTPAENSWWLLVGIAGHGFISTALLASSFIYYRDINAWLKVVLEQLQKQASSVKA